MSGINTGGTAIQDRGVESLSLPTDAMERIITIALEEDFADRGDITGNAIIPADSKTQATLLLKEPAVIAGLAVFEAVLRKVDPALKFEALVAEGACCQSGQVIAQCRGPARSLLAAERTALNLLQRLSGVATKTRYFVELARPLGIAVRDTRKTTPGLRALEKWAVKVAGGTNHRFGLYDAILIKDNHIQVAGISDAIKRARMMYPGMPVQVEVTSIEMLAEALELGAESILLDNMKPELVRQCVARAAGAAFLEVSGGVNRDNFSNYLIAGVNAISIGALTHSVKSIDISLEFEG